MPEFNLYPQAAGVRSADSYLIWQASSEKVKQVTTDKASPATILVEWFGAVGDGVTDDTAAINACLATAVAGSCVEFSGGKTYLTTSVIQIPHDRMTLLGNGCTITSALDTQYQKFSVDTKDGCKILNFTFDCIRTSATLTFAPGAVTITNSDRTTVEDCHYTAVAGSGVYLIGDCSDTTVAFCRMTSCFVGVFSDDDGIGHMPVRTKIIGCSITAGLGTTGTSFSGGIKFSGTGSIASICGHVIANNVISGTGEMGIEIQTMVNDVTIVGNTVSLVGFGISISGCNRVAISGNTVKDCVVYGVEIASSANHITISGNVLTRADRLYVALSLNDFSAHVSITGNDFLGWDTHIFVDQATYCTISSNVCKLQGGTSLNIKSSQIIAVTGNTFVGDASSASYVFIDSTNASVKRVDFSGNVLSGTVANNGITLYSIANTIEDLTVSNNNTGGMVCPGGAWNSGGSSSPATRLLRIRSFGNIGNGSDGFQTSFNMPSYTRTTDTAFPYEYFYWETSINYVDASAANRTFQLPDAQNLGGYAITIIKSDASANTVTVSSYNSRTINGVSTYLIAAQWGGATFTSDGQNWLVTVPAASAYPYLSNELLPASAITLASGTDYDVCGVTLTTGIWEVEGYINLLYTTATSTSAYAYVGALSAPPPIFGNGVVQGGLILAVATGSTGITLPRQRITITTGPFVLWSVKTAVTFSVGTVQAYGAITARQVG